MIIPKFKEQLHNLNRADLESTLELVPLKKLSILTRDPILF